MDADPPYWRRRTAPSELERLGAERWLLLTTAGPAGDTLTAIGRPVPADGRLLLVSGRDAALAERLTGDHRVTLVPCDSRGGPRPAGPFDAVDPVGTSLRAEPVAATARPSPGDERTALIRFATRHRLAAGASGATDTLRRLLGRPAPPPLVLEIRLGPADPDGTGRETG